MYVGHGGGIAGSVLPEPSGDLEGGVRGSITTGPPVYLPSAAHRAKDEAEDASAFAGARPHMATDAKQAL